MTNRNKDLTDLMDQFPDADRKKMEEIWKMSKTARPMIAVSPEEMETALDDVHRRIEKTGSVTKKTSPAFRILNYARYLAAAIALIVFGIGYLMIPKTISVPNSEIGSIELSDGSIVEMNSGTTIRYNRLFSYTNRTITLNGEAYFSVQPDEEPFLVKSNGSVTRVTGTEFNVRSWNDHPIHETTVTVTEGIVQFYAEKNQAESISLHAGQVSRWSPSLTKPSNPETASSDAQLAWRDQRFVFQEAPFIVILNNLERSFDVNIYLDVEGIEMDTLTAYYNRSASIEVILEDLCTVKGLRYTKTSDGYRIFK